jgi:hypothetical protein
MEPEGTGAGPESLLQQEGLFRKTGTIRLRVPRRGQVRTVVLPIQSVDNEPLHALTAPLRPLPPLAYLAPHGKQGKRFRARLVGVPMHDEAVEQYNAIYTAVMVLCGLNLDIEDEHGRVVWSADNRVQDLDAARQVLTRIGLTELPLMQLRQALYALARQEPSGVPPSASPAIEIPNTPWWPAQFYGPIDDPPRFMFHYTTSYALRHILASGGLQPTRTGAKHEKPLVWFSCNQIWEPGATHAAGWLQEARDIAPGYKKVLLFEGMCAVHTNLFRIGVDPAIAPNGFTTMTRLAGWQPSTAKHVLVVAREQGWPVGQHRATLEPVPTTDFQVIDRWHKSHCLWERVWSAPSALLATHGPEQCTVGCS